ncbi:MAG: response regulator [Oscillospiraceae bacterium]|jgi:two-component system response regulator YesN|nr:response regulator [Oscillospiraceae bacterium]
MYSVMIIDDEVTIREKLPRLVDFARYGFTVCATAKNGEEALRLIPRHKPDLLLLDVRMPVMDGLTLLRRLRETEYRDTFVIILSGYSDFEYARTAMEYGVKTYLTKPVDEDEAGRYLEEIYRELDQKQHLNRRNRYRSDVLALRGVYDRRENTPPLDAYYLLHIVPLSLQDEGGHGHAGRILIDTLKQRTETDEGGLIQKGACVHSFLIPKPEGEDGAQNAFQFAEELDAAYQRQGLTCAFLHDMDALERRNASFYQTYSAHLTALLDALFYAPQARFVRYAHPQATAADCTDELNALYDTLRENLVTLNEEAVRETMAKLCEQVHAARLGLAAVRNLTNRVYYLFIGVMTVQVKQGQRPLIPPIEWANVPFFRSFEEWRALMDDQAEWALAFLRQNKSMRRMGVSGEILEYIYQNFRGAVSIKQLAEKFHMSPAYLGRMFQKATGVSFKQYLNELRLTEAKRLLASGDRMIYEIAEEVGFSDSSYFIARFTKEVGVSPMEFRKAHKR